MLLELEIRDFALIDHLHLHFSSGLNVLTGETGAGKSIIMDALNAVLGGKVQSGAIRAQAERAIVEARFSINLELKVWLAEKELSETADDETMWLSREIRNGSSKIRINGTLVNLSLMQELRQKLVSIHAQHESSTLLSGSAQLEMLDAIADNEHKIWLDELKTCYLQRKQVLCELAAIQNSDLERERRLDFARFQLAELNDAQLEDPEESELINQQRQVLSNVSSIESLLSNAQIYLQGHDLSGEPGAIELLQKALSDLGKAASMDCRLVSLETALSECLARLEDESRGIRKHCQSLDSDPETLAHLDERAALLAQIKRKYGPELRDAIKRRVSLEEEVERLSQSASLAADLNLKLEALNEEVLERALAVSKKRKKLAQSLSRKIENELIDLGMLNCKFEIRINSLDKSAGKNLLLDSVNASGLDKVEFLICPNPGQPLLPVSKIASGGELSRVMLALKSIFAEIDGVPTVIFDEIDTGLSGKVLQTMRDRLARLARRQQILCVTHQAITASIADSHLLVSKIQSKEQTCTRVDILDETARIRTLAGMAGGRDKEESALSFARALFQESSKAKAAMR